VSAASAAATIPLILVLLTALLALSLAGIVRAQPWTPGAPDQEPASQFTQPELASDPPTAPLPRRVAGQSGRTARGTGDLGFSPGAIEHYSAGAIEPPRVSGGPPWLPAPRPPGLP
jgi:hypothetical protein